MDMEGLEQRCLLSAPDGSLDSSFGNSGFKAYQLSSATSGTTGPFVNAIAVQSDGKILIGGMDPNPGPDESSDFFLQRLNVNGSIDRTFGIKGSVETPMVTDQLFGAGADIATITVSPDGKILVAGIVGPSGAGEFGVARYTSDGALDSTFNGSGKKLVSVGGADELNSTILLHTGDILLAGRGRETTEVARLTKSGTLDKSFGVNGVAEVGSGTTGVSGMALDSKGDIVLAGTGASLTDANRPSAAIVKLLPNGTIDGAFANEHPLGPWNFQTKQSTLGKDGVLLTDEGSDTAELAGVTVDSHDRIHVWGTRSLGILYEATFSSDGNLETRTDVGFSGRNSNATALTVDSAGNTIELAQILAGKDFQPSTPQSPFQSDVILKRILSNGQSDFVDEADFGGDEAPLAVTTGPDQKIVVLSLKDNTNPGAFGPYIIARFNASNVPASLPYSVSANGTLTIQGTSKNDQIVVAQQSLFGIEVNNLDPPAFSKVVVDGGAGNDSITINGYPWWTWRGHRQGRQRPGSFGISGTGGLSARRRFHLRRGGFGFFHFRHRHLLDIPFQRMMLHIFLVIRLGRVKTVERFERGHDRGIENFGVGELLDICLGNVLLIVVGIKNRRAILVAFVGALMIELGWIVGD